MHVTSKIDEFASYVTSKIDEFASYGVQTCTFISAALQ